MRHKLYPTENPWTYVTAEKNNESDMSMTYLKFYYGQYDTAVCFGFLWLQNKNE